MGDTAHRPSGHWARPTVPASCTRSRRRGLTEVGYFETRSGYEVDFCSRSADGAVRLTQVCVELGAEGTRRRELRALDEAMAELGLGEATLVTLGNREEEVGLDGGTVRVVPAWRWLLEG